MNEASAASDVSDALQQSVLVGTSGWNYPHWKQSFYPETIPKKEWFSHYAQEFSTVELNNTFYRWPDASTIERWKQQAPSDFTYTLKAPRTITHVKRLKDPEDFVPMLYELGSKLGRKIGCYLFQLPPSFARDKRNEQRLNRFLEVLDGRRHNVIEFRDASWWSKEIYALLQKHHVTFCSVMGLGMPSDIVVTSDVMYIRFHGEEYATSYTEHELQRIAGQIMQKLEAIQESARSAKKSYSLRVYVYFNNDEQGFAPKNAKQFRTLLQQSLKK